MRYIKSFAAVLIMLFTMSACTEENKMFEGDSVAQFMHNGEGVLVLSPNEAKINTFLIGVTAVKDYDRSFSISVSDSSTMSEEFYTVETTGVIPAGELYGEFIITMKDTINFPSETDELVLVLDEVTDTDIMVSGYNEIVFTAVPQCESIIDNMVGTYQIVDEGLVDVFEYYMYGRRLIGHQFEIVAGPEANQLTMINPFNSINPDTQEKDYQVVIDVNLETSYATISMQAAWYSGWYAALFSNTNYGTASVVGDGYAFNCITPEFVKFDLIHQVSGGCFGGCSKTHRFKAEKLQ